MVDPLCSLILENDTAYGSLRQRSYLPAGRCDQFQITEKIHVVSRHLGLPEAKIFGVATFYNQFKLSTPVRHRIQICRGTACHVKGYARLLDILEAELGIAADETTKDRRFSLDVVCYGIVKMHGGSIHAGNNPDGGAWFEISIQNCRKEAKIGTLTYT